MLKRIRVIIPVNTPIWNQAVLQDLDSFKSPETSLEVVNLKKGIPSVETHFDEAWVIPFTLEEALKAEEEGCHGALIYCTADPALLACKEALRIPVVGIGEAAFFLAAYLGKRFAILSPGPSLPFDVGPEVDNIKVYGLEKQCVGLKPLEIPVLDLERDREAVLEKLIQAGKEMVKRGADVLVLGCGVLLGLEKRLSAVLQIPVIVPGRVALKLCESLIELGLAQSKRAFPLPGFNKEVTL